VNMYTSNENPSRTLSLDHYTTNEDPSKALVLGMCCAMNEKEQAVLSQRAWITNENQFRASRRGLVTPTMRWVGRSVVRPIRCLGRVVRSCRSSRVSTGGGWGSRGVVPAIRAGVRVSS
jgi:hypothetical protein